MSDFTHASQENVEHALEIDYLNKVLKSVKNPTRITDRMKELEQQGKQDSEEYTDLLKKVTIAQLSNGMVVQGVFRLTDAHLDMFQKEGLRITDAVVEEVPSELAKTSSMLTSIISEFKKSNMRDNAFDFTNRDATLLFCDYAKGTPQFRGMRHTIIERGSHILKSVVYKFKEHLLQDFMMHDRNDIGFREMPRNNMFIEVFLEFGNICVNGIHLMQVMVDPKTGMQFVIESEPVSAPSNFTEEGISVFYSGLDDKVAFFDYFTLDKSQVTAIENLKSVSRFACPICSRPMVDATEHEVYCKYCIEESSIKLSFLYDLNNPRIRILLRTQYMHNIWKVEDAVRRFVCNFLDYYAFKDIKVYALMTDEERHERNKARVKRGKTVIPDVKVVSADGYLHKYISVIKRRFNYNIEEIRHQQWVEGHYMRFWKEEKYTRLYGSIKGLKTDDEIEARLSKIVRLDEFDQPLPERRQYRWDRLYKKIFLRKDTFIRYAESDEDLRTVVKMVKEKGDIQ